MRLIKYKKIKTLEGHLLNPPWLAVGDLFNDGSNDFLGLIFEDNEREYGVPDNLVSVSKQELILKLQGLHQIRPFCKKIMVEGSMQRIECTTVEEFIEHWWEKNKIVEI